MVAEQSCVKRLWTIALESYQWLLMNGRSSWSDHALQAANYRISSLETAAGKTTSAASMVDMRLLGKPSIFAGDEASWKSWSFVLLSFSAAVSPELRTLMEKARTTASDMLNVNLTASEQVWSRVTAVEDLVPSLALSVNSLHFTVRFLVDLPCRWRPPL